MDRSRFKRAETQTQHKQITKTPLENRPPVQRVVQARPQQYVNGTFGGRRPGIDGVAAVSGRPPAGRPARAGSFGQADGQATRLPALALAATVNKPAFNPAISSIATPEAVRRLPLDMELPGEESFSPFDLEKRRAKWRGIRRNASRAIAVAIVLVITLGGLLFSQSYIKLHKVFKGSDTAAALNANVKPDLLKGEGSGRVNILLLGRGGGTHDAPDLTDTMMLASIDPINHKAVLLSLPRDLWVNVPDQGVMKLNAAWETGEFKYLGKKTTGSTDSKAIDAGFDMVDKTVQNVTGVNIDYNILVDFKTFQEAVDTVGGVNINVPSDLIDPTMAWENGGNPVLAQAGLQAFDGHRALIYVRSRETSSDFARAERQRAVLLALKSKIESLGIISNPFKLSGLINAFGNNIQTDLSINNANRLYNILKKVSSQDISSIGLSNASGPGLEQLVAGANINGQAIVLPRAGLFKYDEIQQYLRSQLKDPYILKEKARLAVLNGTLLPGLAATKADELKNYGYNIINVGNAPSGWTHTVVVDLTHGKKKYTKHYLEDRFNVKAVDSLSDTSIPTNGADFVIILGSDETPAAQNQAN